MSNLTQVRPSTPNMVLYDEEALANVPVKSTVIDSGRASSRPGTTNSLAPPPPMQYHPPDTTKEVGAPSIWTIEGEKELNYDDDLDNGLVLEEDDTKILLEKEFDDFYEDQVHKSAGPVVFVSKTLGMLPAIWTEEESESECKSYFNLYTFIIFIGWIGLAVVSGLRVNKLGDFPGDQQLTASNDTIYHLRFISNCAFDTYVACTWVASLIALLFGVFKCRSFAEVLFGLSEIDAQLELKEKHYEKMKRKSLYWIVFLTALLALDGLAFYTMLFDSSKFDLMLFIALILAHCIVFVLDLQYLHFSMVLCKRYRMVNKVLLHITKPWKTFRNEPPPSHIVQNILQHRFDQIFEPSMDDLNLTKKALSQKNLPLEVFLKAPEEPKISKEEENTFIYQMDILRGIHADLMGMANEVNHLLGFQILVHIITCVIFVVMFGYFFAAAAIDTKFYWPYLVLCLLPALRVFLIGHWGQVLEQQSRQPFLTICQVSTVDGSPRLERQVQKLTIQMNHQCPKLTAAGYFNLGRNMILKTIGVAVVFTFFMVKFQRVHDDMRMKQASSALTASTPA
eukprot:maker-scaffold278_size225338-snap-gene-0.13 protein:Tk03812 transcript:maker-scaffold278_size225338-snap-gene-0.13-mRNA-1 annotation:"gustatory receptor 43a-like"